MSARIILPDELTSGPFSVRDAAAAGIGRGRLSGADLAAPFRGVRTGADRTAEEYDGPFTRRRCREYAPLLRAGQFFGFTSAAHLWGCPIRDTNDRRTIHVCARPPARGPRRESVVGHRVDDEVTRVVERFGLPVADAATTFLQLATLLTLDELVVAADHLVHVPPLLDPHDLRPYVTLAEMDVRMAGWHGRGRRLAMEACALMSTAAESRMETLLRLLLTRAGLPDPEVNPVLTGIRRRWKHRADLVYRQRRVIVEYDGDQHRTDTRQYELDIRRFDDFADDGWRVIRVRKHGLLVEPGATVERVRAALAAGGTHPGR